MDPKPEPTSKVASADALWQRVLAACAIGTRY